MMDGGEGSGDIPDHLEVYTDGSTVGRNGKLGTVSQIGVGVWIPAIQVSISRMEQGCSNNVAELRAMYRALEYLKKYDGEIVIYSDSQLAVNWLNNREFSPHQHLVAEQKRLYALAEKLDVEARWIPREKNQIADALASREEERQKLG